MNLNETKIGILGLGYVGLPLAVEFCKKFPTVGFDIKAKRVAELNSGHDATREVTAEELAATKQLTYSTDIDDLAGCNVYIVTVPTPVGKNNRPLLDPLKGASQTVGGVISKGDIVIYESTVYPGCTEEFCVPIIEQASGLKLNRDFFAGYSPERINPGDHERRLPTLMKVTSGSTPESADFIDQLYATIITAGTHKAPSLQVAEAAKVIENTQRDVNIALINELALIFNRLDVDTEDVLAAAATKWNFLPFKPGLVGGHCIGVDPYYLTHKAEELGYHPQMILAGRRLNDSMSGYVASEVIKLMISRHIQPADARVLVMGLTFKENCPDVRNTKVVEIVHELQDYRCQVDVYDPWVDPHEAREQYGVELLDELAPGNYDAIIIAVAHREFVALGAKGIHALGSPNHVIYDIKHILPKEKSDGRL